MQLITTGSSRDQTFYESKCATLDRQIDNLVYELYDLTPEEIFLLFLTRNSFNENHCLSSIRSRRITDEHRLIYKVTDEQLTIASCKYHYE